MELISTWNCKREEILYKLDIVINEVRFLSSELRLEEGVPVSGFVEKGKMQYFYVSIKGQLSPLEVHISRKFGSLRSLVSLKVIHPSLQAYDWLYTTDNFQVKSKFLRFTQSKCHIGIEPLTDCSFTITCILGKEKNLRKKLQVQSCTVLKVDSKSKAIKELERMDTNARNALKARVEQTLQERKKAHRVNFVKVNMNHTSGAIKVPRDRSESVLARKKELYKEKIQSLIYNTEKKERERAAEKIEQQRLLKINTEKAFCRQWMKLIYLMQVLRVYNHAYDKRIRDIRQRFVLAIQTSKVQIRYRNLFEPGFDINTRNRALAKNLLILSDRHSYLYKIQRTEGKIAVFLKNAYACRNAKNYLQHFINSVIVIQKFWRKCCKDKEDYFDDLSILWDQIAKEKILEGKNKALIKALSNIKDTKKTFHISKMINEARQKVREQIRKGYKLLRLQYWPSDQEIEKNMIIASKTKRKTRNSFARN